MFSKGWQRYQNWNKPFRNPWSTSKLQSIVLKTTFSQNAIGITARQLRWLASYSVAHKPDVLANGHRYPNPSWGYIRLVSHKEVIIGFRSTSTNVSLLIFLFVSHGSVSDHWLFPSHYRESNWISFPYCFMSIRIVENNAVCHILPAGLWWTKAKIG